MLVRLVTIIALISASLLAWAVPVDLTHAVISVPNQSQSSLSSGMLEGFKQVLVKASGNASINTLPAIEQAETNIQQYVLSYHFIQPQADTWQLNVSFDPKGIKKLLSQNGQAFWGANRPQTLVWLNLPSKASNQFLASGAQSPVSQSLKQLAAARGLPMLLPVMDLTDQAAIGSSPANWFKLAWIVKASQRYQLNSILIGQVVQRSEGWQGRWLSVYNDEPVQWQTNGDTEQAVIEQGINQLADILASQGAVITNGQQTVLLKVNGLNGLGDYAKVVQQLKKISVVNQVDLQTMTADGATLSVGISGSVAQLQGLLKQDGRLVAQGQQQCGSDVCYGYEMTSKGQDIGVSGRPLVAS